MLTFKWLLYITGCSIHSRQTHGWESCPNPSTTKSSLYTIYFTLLHGELDITQTRANRHYLTVWVNNVLSTSDRETNPKVEFCVCVSILLYKSPKTHRTVNTMIASQYNNHSSVHRHSYHIGLYEITVHRLSDNNSWHWGGKIIWVIHPEASILIVFMFVHSKQSGDNPHHCWNLKHNHENWSKNGR